jgi:hypothetical protein
METILYHPEIHFTFVPQACLPKVAVKKIFAVPVKFVGTKGKACLTPELEKINFLE